MIVNRYNTTAARPRVVICGAGYYGGFVAQALEDSGYELVGAYNRAGPKIGQDIGRVTWRNRDFGVFVEDIATADLKKVKADVAICTQSDDLCKDMPSYTRLMEAGINIISLAMEAYYPFGSDPERAAEIDAIARRNKVTFTGSGIHDMSRIWSGIIACGQCTQLESIYHESLTDAADQVLPERLAGGMTMLGTTVEEYLAKGVHKARLWPVYTVTLEHVLTALGYTVVEKGCRVEPIVWDEPLENERLNLVVPAGRVLGTRTIGFVKTREGVTGNVKTEARICRKGEVDHMLWRIEGKPCSEVIVKRRNADYTNAACLVGRVKDVMAATPGIVPVSQYGPLQGPELVPHSRRKGW
jgi:2,4-diaminopentanoate dehydrogenase